MAITAAAGGGAWSAGGSWVGGIAPTAADDVLLTVTSGNITIDGTSGTPNLCRSLTCTGYTGTLAQGASAVLNIGDSGGGLLLLVAGMTYVPNTSATLNFVSTTGVNNITTAGKTMCEMKFNGVGGSWQLQDTLTIISARVLTLTAGTLDLNGQTVSAGGFSGTGATTRVLTMGASSITLANSSTAWDCTTVTNLTINANTSTITLSGSGAVFIGGGKTYNTLVFTGGGGGTGAPASITGANVFANLTFTGTAVQTDGLSLGSNITVNTALTITGNSVINRPILHSSVRGTQRTITLGGSATFKTNSNNLDIEDVLMSGGATNERDISAITGLSGDCGGNSGITFTSPATSYWVPSAGTSTGTMSAVTRWANASGGTAGTGRAPLPQDTSVFNASSIDAGSRTITLGMVRAGSIDFSLVTNTPAFSKTGGTCTFYGSLTLANGITQSGTTNFVFAGRGSNTITAGSTIFTNPISVDCISGTVTSLDNISSSTTFALTSGNYVASSSGCTFTTANVGTGSVTRSIDMGTGTWTLTTTGTVWSTTNITGLTFTKNTSTIEITGTSATGKTFGGGGLSYHSVKFTGDNITVSGSSSFDGTFNVNNAGRANGLKMTIGTTQTLTASSNCFITNGSLGNLAILQSTSAGTPATLTATNQAQISVDFMSIKDSTVTQTNTWYAGANSTNVSGNTNWIFTAPPVPAGGSLFLGSTKINQLYLGSTQIKKAYLGSTLVYSD